MSISSKKGLFISFKTSTTRNRRLKTENVCFTSFIGGHCDHAGDAKDPPLEHVPARFELDETVGVATSSKRQKLEEDWCLIKDELLAVGLSTEMPASFCCCICEDRVDEPIRCLDCNASFICCESCEARVHERVLHKPEIWKVC